MYRYNFPNRKQLRRQRALDRLKKQSATDDAHAKTIKAATEALEAKLKGNAV